LSDTDMRAGRHGKAWGSTKLVEVKLWATVVAALCVVVRCGHSEHSVEVHKRVRDA
jgi:hypothetical protein